MSTTQQYTAIIQPRPTTIVDSVVPAVKRFRPNHSSPPDNPNATTAAVIGLHHNSPLFASASTSPGSSLMQQHQQQHQHQIQQSLFIETMSNNNGGGSSYSSPSPILSEIKTEPQAYSPTPTSLGGHSTGHHIASTTTPPPQYYLNGGGETSSLASPASPLDTPGGGLRHPNPPLTPTGAVQQYSQMVENERKKKGGGGSSSRPAEELCLVCGDRASGYHYNALACEGCKGFFRRSITKNSSYTCKWNGDCEIDMYMRRKCQACRLKKCYATGMRAECVVPERTCIQKRQAKAAAAAAAAADTTVDAPKSNPLANGKNSGGHGHPHPSQMDMMGGSSSSSSSSYPKRLSCTKPLKPEEEELINRLVYFQEEYEHPTEADLNRVYHVPMHSTNSSESESDRLFRHMTEMTILTVQLIVEFSKHLPGFQNLCRDDQINLLKGCSSEVMMLRGARRYDAESDSIVYATNYPFTKENYAKAGLGNDELFRFCRAMSRMKVDNAEYALITAIVIFSDRNSLREPKRVEKIQEIYVDALQAYVLANRKKNQMVTFAKLLYVLTELRSLGISNSELCFSLKLKNRKLPPFLMEIWDIE